MSLIHEKDALILRTFIGSANDQNNKELYELCTSMRGTMFVKSMVSGRTFEITWTDVIHLAVEAGVNNQPE